jgi:hypothetical protein
VTDRHALVIAPRAARALSDELPEAVAWAVIELITGPSLDSPRRIGHELRNELAGSGAPGEATSACSTGSTMWHWRSPCCASSTAALSLDPIGS